MFLALDSAGDLVVGPASSLSGEMVDLQQGTTSGVDALATDPAGSPGGAVGSGASGSRNVSGGTATMGGTASTGAGLNLFTGAAGKVVGDWKLAGLLGLGVSILGLSY